MRYLLSILLLFITAYAQGQTSVCYGTTKHGRLAHAAKLPYQGKNFISYGNYPELAERTYVHSLVKKIVVKTYEKLETLAPNRVFKYAETGFKDGGRFPPHKTHQNGLSIDFMVPVINTDNKSVYFPTKKSNRYGYDVEFNTQGKSKYYTIDFDALAMHIATLHKVAKENGVDLWRVLFAPDLQAKLYMTAHGDYIKENIHIPTKRSWVRHDEHYHIDFDVKCRKM